DPWNGRRDLESGILRHVSPAFAEDPLRVLRGMQLAARFGFDGAPETLALCRSIEPEGLARERIFDEWKKLILAGRQISRGMRFLRASGWLVHFPELAALVHCPQDPEWHPEGDVWTHTAHVLDAFAEHRLGDATEDLVVGLACLCHDFGKPATTHFVDGRWRSPNHEAIGDPPTRAFLGRMTDQRDLIEAIVPLVREHLKPIQLYAAGSGPAAIRRLARRVGRIDRLVRVCRADHAGRPPLSGDFPAGDWLLDRATTLRLEAEAPKPIVQGRHLIELGLKPGRHFGPILEACFEAQLDGAFDDLDRGLHHAARILAETDPANTESVTRADEY
ncbi:MAG: HD domain-containing protein, partial [Acidobacteriota bacterium]